MNVQVIMKDGRPEWAVLPYAEYEALLAKVEAAQGGAPVAPVAAAPVMSPPASTPAADNTSVDNTAPAGDSLRPEDRRQLRNSMMEQLKDVAAVADAGTFQGSKMAEVMRSRGLSAELVAREVGISPVYLKQIENGEREPSEPILRNIARALSVDVKELSV